MSNKKDYSIKFYNAIVRTTNDDSYKLAVSANSESKAENLINDFLEKKPQRFHLDEEDNSVESIDLQEVSTDQYGSTDSIYVN